MNHVRGGYVPFEMYRDRTGRIVDVNVGDIHLNGEYFGTWGEKDVEWLRRKLVEEGDLHNLEILHHELYHKMTIREMVLGAYEVDTKLIEGSAYLYGKVMKHYDMTGDENRSLYLALQELYTEKQQEDEEFLEKYVDPAIKIAEKIKGSPVKFLLKEVPRYRRLDDFLRSADSYSQSPDSLFRSAEQWSIYQPVELGSYFAGG